MKKTVLFTFLMFLLSVSIYAQSNTSNVAIGDVFVIGEANDNYNHINFPKANFIIKKGGIVSYKNIVGEKVEVTSVKEDKDGQLVATIKLASKKKFFNSHKYVTVVVDKAIETKELVKI